jgi:hypothetical protein
MFFLPELSSSKPSLKLNAVLALGGLYIAAEIAIWMTFVPEALSVQTFGWMSALAFMTTIAGASSVVRARSTRSIAHVLYDVEHPSDSPRL